jgi:putative ABC transport system permease protein
MLSGIIAQIRSLFSGARNANLDAEMQAEFEHHMEMRAADLVKSGVSPDEAARRARAEFGGSYNYKEAGREARGLRWFDTFRISWLDMKLGARMARRYPGLTVVSAIAMGVAIAIGAGVMGVIAVLKDPSLPLHEGERIVGIQMWSVKNFNAFRQIGYDFLVWKKELKQVRDVGAFRTVVRAIGVNDGRAEPARGAEISAAGFRVARVSPLLGRYLVDDDERAGGPLVAVLGHDLWSGRFGSDSSIVGKPLKIGGVEHTIVGVMPPGFAWPINYNLWLPLRLDPNTQPGEGPILFAFGRLAPGASLEDARAELTPIGDRVASELPDKRGHVRPHVMGFPQSWFELDSPETQMVFAALQLGVTLLLLIICVNIAILVYARTATRHAEIAVRSALGASRMRIVAQLVGEALVLAGLGGVVALGLISVIAGQLGNVTSAMDVNGNIPFWLKLEISPATVGYLVLLAVAAALVIGVVPALQLTGKRVQANLQRLSGHASVRMGKLWTSLIVAQVAVTVAILPSSVFLGAHSLKALAGPGFPAEQYLSAELGVSREPNETGSDDANRRFDDRVTRLRDEVIRRLQAEPEVAAVTFSADVPGNEGSRQLEVEGLPAKFSDNSTGKGQFGWGGENARRARTADVDHAFFETFRVAPIMGRTFSESDLLPGTRNVVVNRTFADSIFGGANPVGRKIRWLGYGAGNTPVREEWQEIVGVVPNFPAFVDFERPRVVVYSVVRHVQPALLSIHMRGGADPLAFSSRLRAITADVDQSMFLRGVQPLSETIAATHLPLQLATTGLIVIALSVLILSSAGLYALMLVTVTQRRREIGIRIALGADRRRVLSGIFWRAGLQVGGGIAIGLAIAMVANHGDMKMDNFPPFIILPSVSLLMLAVGVLAALGPARRGLAIQPSVVLKED